MLTNKKDIRRWLDNKKIEQYKINKDLTVDVFGRVDIKFSLNEVKELPVQFGKVYGHYFCSEQDLTSLKGSPYEIFGTFDCSNNLLDDLRFSPVIIHSTFDCSYNKLKSFQTFPENIGLDLYINNNLFTPESLLEFNTIVKGEIYNDLFPDTTSFINHINTIKNILKEKDILSNEQVYSCTLNHINTKRI